MTDPRLVEVLRFYDSLIAGDFDDARTVGWRSAQTQRRNFAALADIFAKETGRFSVYDVGCGLADLSRYLQEVQPAARYAGCDIHPTMIARARLRHPGVDVQERNILESPPEELYDYVVASGTFSHCAGRDRAWTDYVHEMMGAMFRIARRGIAVVFLSTFADLREAGDYHEDPSEILRFAQRELSSLAEIRHSFSPWTFAIFIYRNATGEGLI